MAVGTTVFFAGAEVSTFTNALLDARCRNILYSYYHILTRHRDAFVDQVMNAHPEVNFFLDSGAFTYGAKKRGQNKSNLVDVKRYVRRYFAYIDAVGEKYCRIAEPDLDIAGLPVEMVDDWREEMLGRWPHLNITPVWHEHRGESAWYEYLADKRIKTLAIGSGVIRPQDAGFIRKLVMLAAREGKPTHGFGCTQVQTTLKHVPFDSVDSSSVWKGQRTGTTFIFRDNRWIVLEGHQKANRKLYKSYFKNIGCDVSKIMKDDVAEVRKANVKAWIALAGRLETIKNLGRQTKGVDNVIFSVPND